MGRRMATVFLVWLLSLGSCGGDGPSGGMGLPTPTPVPGGPVIFPGVPIAQSGPADLTICYVERLPKIDYVVNAADPTVEGWPSPGSTVTWRAHVKNWSDRTLDGVEFTWSLDGADVASGQVSVPAHAETNIDFQWSWVKQRHELQFVLDPDNRHTVDGGPRNRVLIYTDALSIGLYVEQRLYDYFRQNQASLHIGNSSFEDWAHFQVEVWNRMFANAITPEAPQGVLDRARLDAVHIVADGALPLDPTAFSIGGSFPPQQARPNVADRTVDMQWGFPSELVDAGVYQDVQSLATNNQFYYSGYLQHEMGHARYLIDVYGFDVFSGTAGTTIQLQEKGVSVPGSQYMPGQQTIYNGVPGIQVHRTPYQGLMTSDWTKMDRYSAAALNRIAGRRALDGNYNEPRNLGVFLSDLPAQNLLSVRDSTGTVLAGARVQVFQATPGDSTNAVYTKFFDARPDLDLRADAQGQVALGRNPFSRNGRIEHGDAYSNGVIIVRVEQGDKAGYGFLEIADFNLEFWRGNRETGHYELRVPLL